MKAIEKFHDSNHNYFILEAHDNGDIILRNDKEDSPILRLDQGHYNMLTKFLRVYKAMGIDKEQP